ncbi:MAG TPA: TniQ family protein [Solimonas sp.]
MATWPIRRVALPGELFSSWLLRNVQALGGAPYGFCRAVWRDVAFWTRDTDRSVPDRVVLELAEYTGTSRSAAHATTLRSVLSLIGDCRIEHGVEPWLLPAGVFHRLRTRHGLQFCPACLATDREPYYRRDWRFAFSFLCVEHGVYLRDACLCGAPVVTHKAPELKLSMCHRCGEPLAVGGQSAGADELAAQRYLLQIVSHDRSSLGDETVSRRDLLLGIRLLLVAIASSAGGRRLIDVACSDTSGLPPKLGGAPEQLRTAARARALPLVVALLRDWPDTFLRYCGAAECNYRSIAIHRMATPTWIERVIAQLPRRDRPRISTKRRRRRSAVPRISWGDAFDHVATGGDLPRFVASRLGTR